MEKLTLDPWHITAADVAPLRQQGLSNAAIEEAIGVCLCFSTLDRLADAFNFPLSTGRQRTFVEFMLTRLGYAGASLPG